ncbi:MAG: hypothetical protein ACI3X2_10965, partial [Butyricicoccus porcorum]
LDLHLRDKHGNVLCMNLANTSSTDNTNLHENLSFFVNYFAEAVIVFCWRYCTAKIQAEKCQFV